MARIRTIKPEFWLDEDLASVSAEAKLLAIGLLNQSDDEGYFKANPMIIKAAIFPFSESSVNVQALLKELSKIGYIEVGKGSDGKDYGRVTNFLNHQKINRPSDSKIKELWEFTEDSVSDHGGITEDSPPERKGKEQGKERKSANKFTEEDFALAGEVFALVKQVAPKAKKPNLDSWADDIRLMRESDGHTLDEIRTVFLFANQDEFWKTNILSTGKLRKQFSSLHAKMTTGGSNASSQSGSSRYPTKSELADEAVRKAIANISPQ